MTQREAWEHYVGLNWTDRFNDPEEEEKPEKFDVNIDVDTSKLDDEEVTELINKLESLSYVSDFPYYGDFTSTFTVNYDLDENGNDDAGTEIVLIQLRGYCVGYYKSCDITDTLNSFNVDYTEK